LRSVVVGDDEGAVAVDMALVVTRRWRWQGTRN
jgi:hypothetical protein